MKSIASRTAILFVALVMACGLLLAGTAAAFAEGGAEESNTTNDSPIFINVENLPTVWGEKEQMTSYTVTETCTIEERVEIQGDVTLVLNDGVELTLPKGIRLKEGNSLTIDSQSKDANMGKLIATGDNGNAAIGGDSGKGADGIFGDDGEACGTLNVNGGAITAKGLADARGFGGGRGANAYIGGDGGKSGVLAVNAGTCAFSSEAGAAIGGGAGGTGHSNGVAGAGTKVSWELPIGLKAGADKQHLTDGEYKDQRCAVFEEGDFFVTFKISGKDQFVRAIFEGVSVGNPRLDDGEKYAVWYTDSSLTEKYDFSQPAKGDMTLYGDWESLSFAYTRWNEQGSSTLETRTFPVSNVIYEDNLPTVWGTAYGRDSWYVVAGKCTIEERVEIVGHVNLVLADDAELYLPNGIHLLLGDNSLTVYSQSQRGEHMGKIVARKYDGDAALGGNAGAEKIGEHCSNLTIHGGSLEVMALQGEACAFGGGHGGVFWDSDSSGRRFLTGCAGGNGGMLYVFGGKFTASAEYAQALAGGLGGLGSDTRAPNGAATRLTLGAMISTLAGSDADHATETKYTDQHYVRFEASPLAVSFEIAGRDAFTEWSMNGMPVLDPRLIEDGRYAVWYTDPGHTDAYDFSQPVTKDMTLYGVWTDPSITYGFTRWDMQGNPTEETHAFIPSRVLTQDNMPNVWGKFGEESWYAVAENCTVNQRIDVQGVVNLVLSDDATLTLPAGIHLGEGNSLNIFSVTQSGEHMGRLVASGDTYNPAIGGNLGQGEAYSSTVFPGESCGALTIHGGTIEANGYYDHERGRASRAIGGAHGAGTSFEVGSDGGAGGELAILGGTCIAYTESVAAVGGGEGGEGSPRGATGADTVLTLGSKAMVWAGADASHATDTEYTGQSYVRFEASVKPVTVTFQIEGREPFTVSVGKGLPVADPELVDGGNNAVWYSDFEHTFAYDFSQPVMADMTLYGTWEAAPTVFAYTRWDELGTPTEETRGFPASHVIDTDNLPVIWGNLGQESWYAVSESCTFDGQIDIWGDVNLVLADDATLTLPAGMRLAKGNSLTVYSQAQTGEHMGKLIARGADGNAAIGGRAETSQGIAQGLPGEDCGALIVHGGAIDVAGQGTSRGFGGGQGGVAFLDGGSGGAGGELTIFGGTCLASSESGAAVGGGNGGIGLSQSGSKGNPTDLTLGTRIAVQAGSDEQHMSDIRYYDQSCVRFEKGAVVTFDISGKALYETTVNAGSSVPDPMLFDNGKLSLWYTDSGCSAAYDFSQPVTEDMTLYGVWVGASNVIDFTGRDKYGNSIEKGKVFDPNNPGLIRSDNLPSTWGSAGQESWYAVSTGSYTISERIAIEGDVNLILTDGATLTLPAGIRLVKGNSLTVYSQSPAGEKMGKLIATGVDGSAAIGGNVGMGNPSQERGDAGDACGLLVVQGGAVTVEGKGETRGFGGGRGGDAAFHGGNGGAGGELIIFGGMLIASSENGAAIGGGSVGTGGIGTVDGSPTYSFLGSAVMAKAGADADHATFTEYNGQSYAEFGEFHTHTIDGSEVEFTEWSSDSSLPTKPGNYYLTHDVTLDGTWGIPMDNAPINLCLNGHVVRQTAEGVRGISVGSRSTLNLHDCNGDGCTHEGYIDSSGLWHLGAGEGTPKSITGGVITGSTSGATFVYGYGRINMYGGTLAGNKANRGGAVYSDGAFNLYGGAIVCNTASYGGAVNVNSGTSNMYGGTICGNTATWGGAVMNWGAFNMYGGDIRGNRSTGGGNAGGVYNEGSFAMYGGVIAENSGDFSGAGVYNNGSMVVGGSSVIYGNTVGGKVNNLRVAADKPIAIGTGENSPMGDMKVGITLKEGKGAFTQECSDYSASFMADSSSVRVVFNGDGRYLELVGTGASGIDLERVGDGSALPESALPVREGDDSALPEPDNPADNGSDDSSTPDVSATGDHAFAEAAVLAIAALCAAAVMLIARRRWREES